MERRGAAAAAFLLAAALGGCGPRFADGEALRKQGRLLQAAEAYAAFALENPAEPEAPKALAAAAELYSADLGLCAKSLPLLERLAREYPAYKMPEELFRRIFVCPDYFPASSGRAWTYGDSQTLGKNARQVVELTDFGPRGASVKSTFFAGDQQVSSQRRAYRFKGMNFLESQDRKDTVILAYPLEQGKVWNSSGPEGRLEFRVEKTGLRVKVAAGEYSDCVKVRRRAAGLPSWIFEYYAPWTGRILTAVGGPGYENRVTELLKYEEKK